MAFGTGHGATLTLAGQGRTYAIRQMDGMEWSGPSADVSHLGTTTGIRFMLPPDLVAGQPWNLQYLWDTEGTAPIFPGDPQHPTDGIEVVTLTFKLGIGEQNPAKFEGNGWLVRSRSPDLASNQENVGQLGIQWQDAPNWDPADPAP